MGIFTASIKEPKNASPVCPVSPGFVSGCTLEPKTL